MSVNPRSLHLQCQFYVSQSDTKLKRKKVKHETLEKCVCLKLHSTEHLTFILGKWEWEKKLCQWISTQFGSTGKNQKKIKRPENLSTQEQSPLLTEIIYGYFVCVFGHGGGSWREENNKYRMNGWLWWGGEGKLGMIQLKCEIN